MFDFRYHVVTLVAVFAALAIGILIGVTIVGKVVTGAERNLSESLRSDLKEASDDRSDSERELRRSNEFQSLVYPTIVGSRLSGKSIGLIAIGDTGGVVEDVRKALDPSGANFISNSTVSIPIKLDSLSDALQDTRFSDIDTDEKAVGKFGKTLGRELVDGGRLAEQVKHSLFSSRSGRLDSLDGVVYVRADRDDLKGEEKKSADRFESALIKGMLNTGVPVVGVEEKDSDPSQVMYYRDHELASVDDVDIVAGRVALVLALQGAKGQFGIGQSATELLPHTLLSDKVSGR